MLYEPKALPQDFNSLRNLGATDAFSALLLVGSSARDADNKGPQTSHSVFAMRKRGLDEDQAALQVVRTIPGTRRVRTLSPLRHELRLPSGMILNLNFCNQPWMFDPEEMIKRVPNGLSAIAIDLTDGRAYATQLYRYDRDEKKISQRRPPLTLEQQQRLPAKARDEYTALADHDNRIALSVQRKYPAYDIIDATNGRVITPGRLQP